MENFNLADWQLTLSADATLGRAASALVTLPVQGVAVRPTAPKAAFAPFAALVADVATDGIAAKRDRNPGMGHTCISAVYVPGSLAWSPPI